VFVRCNPSLPSKVDLRVPVRGRAALDEDGPGSPIFGRESATIVEEEAVALAGIGGSICGTSSSVLSIAIARVFKIERSKRRG
jgi:hypothetical protein